MAEKWFYKLQSEANKMIDETYEKVSYCNWQDVTKDRVYESWAVARKDNKKFVNILVVMHKSTERIDIYEL